jgi:aspartyl-tRNA(Asn)/glutamyl-tRNA(Gln) amidotransferase subunit A
MAELNPNPARLDAEELLQHFAARTLTPLDALQAVTERIARQNPEINAFVVMNPQALDAARASTARWQAGRPQGALDGVPVTVKDLIDIAGLPTRRGSKTTDPAPALQDSPLVTALRASGAVLLGKTTTTEYGWKSPGDCPLNGITRNPWNPAHTPGGSSAGAAAAAASGFGPLHVGTDAGGSVRIPAAWSGIVGLKPSFGRVPQWPLGAFGHVAVAGPMARTVRDAALMLNVLARFDARDPFALPDDPRDWRNRIEDGARGLRIAVLRKPGFAAPVDQDGLDALEIAIQILRDEGAAVEEVNVALPDCSLVFNRVWGAAITRLVSTVPEEKRHLLDPGLLQVAAHNENVTAQDVLEAEAMRVKAANAMAMLHLTFNAVICPCVPTCAPKVDKPIGDPVAALWNDWAPWTLLFNLTRQPAISLPVGVNAAGLPRAVQVAAALYKDDIVLRIARAVERVL